MDKLKQYADTLKETEATRAKKLWELNRRRLDEHLPQAKYEQERTFINNAFDRLKQNTQKEYELYKKEYRKALALQLNAPSDPSPEAEARWRKAIDKVQNAKTHEQINALCREASMWKDADLARALTLAHAGTREKEYIHFSVLGQDAIVDELYKLEREAGGYLAPTDVPPEHSSWDGWTSPDQIAGADGIPGRVHSINPKRRRDEERQEEQRRQEEGRA